MPMSRLRWLPLASLLVFVAFTLHVLNPRRVYALGSSHEVSASLAVGAAPLVTPKAKPGPMCMDTRGAAMACEGSPAARALAATPDVRYSALLRDLRQQANRAKLQKSRKQLADPEAKEARALSEQMKALETAVDASFSDVEQQIKDRRLPAKLLERHRAAVKQFKARRDQLGALLRRVAQADDGKRRADRDAALMKVNEILRKQAQGERFKPVDLSRLPFRTPDSTARTPAISAEGYPDALFRERQTVAPRASAAPSAVLPPPDTLTPTEDIQITEPIRQLAAQLSNNPIAIYHWVHRNIEFIPTYGSVQGSDLTFVARRGNAFDTSSLLIALYRAAGIPARYIYGTIEVPAAQAMNWVGGVTSPEAAQQLMGQGGIPNVAIVQGGTIRSIRLEHVWVEVQVDFVPSRGAINRSPDTWIALDPSFKQYTYSAPIDLRSATQPDIEAVGRQIASTGVVDPQTGSLTGLNLAAFDRFKEELAAKVQERFGPELELSQVTGSRTVVQDTSQSLPAGLPNQVVAQKGTYARLPDGLRHRLSLTVYASDLDRALDVPSLTYSIDLPSVAGKRLGVTYAPATEADAAALASYRSTTSGTLPVYLLNVAPAVQIDGVEVARGQSTTMGQEQSWDVRLTGPGNADPPDAYRVTAGDEVVIGLNGSGITQSVIHNRFQQRPSDTAAENLYTIALYYWAQQEALNDAIAANHGIVALRLPSVGLFSSPLVVQYFYGLPRVGYYAARGMDVGRSIVAAVNKSTGTTSAEFQRLSGTMGSLLEGRTFDSLLGRPHGSGVSAVQLLRDADAMGIPIQMVTAENYDAIAPRLNIDADIIAEIQNAVRAGKRVFVSEHAPAHNGWNGTGYIIEDPETGAAAYLINGSLRGGADNPCPPEPVRVPIVERIIIAVIIMAIFAAIVAAIFFLVELILVAGTVLAALGPLLARLMVFLGLSAPAIAVASQGRPGNGILPPGTCTPEQHAALQVAVNSACGAVQGSCLNFTTCIAIDYARAQWLACYEARNTINVACFMGGDDGHYWQEQEALRNYGICVCMLARLNC